jgi:hypothetical protein
MLGRLQSKILYIINSFSITEYVSLLLAYILIVVFVSVFGSFFRKHIEIVPDQCNINASLSKKRMSHLRHFYISYEEFTPEDRH